MRTDGSGWFEHDLSRRRRPAAKQDGWKEHLLCHPCEGRIAQWEKIVCEQLRGGRGATTRRRFIPYDGPILFAPGTRRPGFHMVEFGSCDYAAWRLFMLSLLWRMDKATLPELAAVDLGEDAEVIQEMLLAADPGNPMDYPCWMYILHISGRPLLGFMNTPHQANYKGYRAIELTFGGLGWFFVIGRQVHCQTLQSVALNRAGRMHLMFREARTVTWFLHGLQRLDDLGNWHVEENS